MKTLHYSILCALGLGMFHATEARAAVIFGAPHINTTPGAVVADGTTVTMNASVTTDSGLALYQWLKDGLPLANGGGVAGATTNKLVIKPAKNTHTGSYRVQVREIILGGGVGDPEISDPFDLTVHQRPVITTHPLPQNKNQDDGLMLSVAVSPLSEPTLQYEWQLNNVPIDQMANPSAGTADFVIPARDPMDPVNVPGLQLPNAGNYRVKVSNLSGISVFSKTALVKINSAALILEPLPAQFFIATKATGKLAVKAGGTPKLLYQWEIEGEGNVAKGGNAAAISIPGVAANDGKKYRVTVSNALNNATHPADVSSWVEIKVIDKVVAPEVTAALGINNFAKAATFDSGTAPVLTVQASMVNTGTLMYQWQKDGKNISDTATMTGTNSRDLVFTDIRWQDRGVYRCIVKNEVSVVTSKTFKVEVNSHPVILTQPATNLVGITGGGATTSVIVGGSGKPLFQWFKKTGGPPQPVNKATTNKLNLTKLAKTAPAGEDYYCEITNPFTATLGGGMATTTNDCNLVVFDPAKITTHPASQSVRVNNNITMTVGVTGDTPMVFEWWFGKIKLANGPLGSAIISGADTASLTITNIQSGLQGSYYCMVRNAQLPGQPKYLVNAKSKTATIKVIMPPTIARQTQASPASPVVEEDRVTVSIVGGGTPPLKYQWQMKVGVGGTWGDMKGKTAAQLIFGKITLADDAFYRCVVNNSLNEPVTSDELELKVDLIPSPVITSFTPSIGRGGEFIRVTGSNFNYAKTVSHMPALGNPVNTTFVIESDTSLLITVANAAPTTASPIRIANRGSNVPTTSATNYTRTTLYQNDSSNPRIMIKATETRILGDNTGLDDPLFGRPLAWYSWTPPLAGNYALVLDSTTVVYDPIIIFRRPAAGGGFTTTFWDTPVYSTQEIYQFSITAANVGRQHFYAMGAFIGSGLPTEGPFVFDLLYSPSFEPPTSDDVNDSSAAAASLPMKSETSANSSFRLVENMDGEQLVQLGGNASALEPTVLWSETASNMSASNVVCSFHAGLDAVGEGLSDVFAWQATGVDGAPLLQVRLNSADGSVELVQPDGTTQTAAPLLVADSLQHFEITLDLAQGTWLATMNGVALGDALPLPANAVFGDLSAVWYPAGGNGPVSSMTFDRVGIRSE
ncbi:MAG TPA: hypothetical protein DIT13_15615 [Verrucomicrobiales bacterium]|nr:hypothetical protein [Verrucomicrobiales bacterium]HRK13630.1 immunoglobulin domain-containing protein [Prosthecobacter sp.]